MNREMMRQAQQLQARLAKAQQELEHQTVEASAGSGAVTVIMTGQQKVVSVVIKPEAVDPDDIPLLEDLVITAVNEALEKSRQLAASRLEAITGGFKLPGM
jgi:DNA-binding YbaB/EbfC family protein